MPQWPDPARVRFGGGGGASGRGGTRLLYMEFAMARSYRPASTSPAEPHRFSPAIVLALASHSLNGQKPVLKRPPL